jgi:hypothetical protein
MPGSRRVAVAMTMTVIMAVTVPMVVAMPMVVVMPMTVVTMSVMMGVTGHTNLLLSKG